MSCYNTPCTCVSPCTPSICTDGCLTDTQTNCVTISEDIVIATNTYTKGTDLTEVLGALNDAIDGNITITATDIKSKVSASDTTSDYLNNKLVGASTSISKTVLSPGGNEQLQFAVKVSPTGVSNQIQVLADGLYVPAPSSGSSTTVSAVDTNSIDTTVTSVVGGYTVKGDVRIDSVTGGNILTVGSNGLYVPPYTPSPSLSVTSNDTSSFDSIVTLVGSTYNVGGNVRIDPSSTAPVSITSQGLKIDCCATGNTTITTTDTQSIDYTLTPISGGYNITSSVIISPTAGNTLQQMANGLYVATPSIAFSSNDTNSIDLTWSSNILSADIKYQDSSTVDLSVPNSSGLKADLKISAVAGNGLSIQPDGLYSSMVASGSCTALTGSDIGVTLSKDKNGEIYVLFTPQNLYDYDTIRVKVTYTKYSTSEFSILTLTKIIPFRSTAGVDAAKMLLPDFDINTSQTVTLDIRRQCSPLSSVEMSASYSTTISYTAPTIALDTWVTVPGGLFVAGASNNVTTPAKYKISKDRRNLYFKGRIDFTNTNTILTNTVYNSASIPIINITTLVAELNSAVGSGDEVWATTFGPMFVDNNGTMKHYRLLRTNSGNEISLQFEYFNKTGSTINNIGFSGVPIDCIHIR